MVSASEHENKVHSISNYRISLHSNERAAFSYLYTKTNLFHGFVRDEDVQKRPAVLHLLVY